MNMIRNPDMQPIGREQAGAKAESNREWRTSSIHTTIQAHRTGWIGVWDSLVSAVTGNDRLAISKPITITFSSKAPYPVSWSVGKVEITEE